MTTITPALNVAIDLVLDLQMYYEEKGKHHLAGFAENARRQLEAARHIEEITKK